MSIIPPKAAKRPGMPKLSIPSRPSTGGQAGAGTESANAVGRATSGHSQAASGSGSGSGGTSGFNGSSAGVGPPSLTLSTNFSSTTNADESAYDGYEGSVGYHSVAGQSLYPDTVPQSGPAGREVTDFTAMTNDLRRAIGGMRIDENGAGGSRGKAKAPTEEELKLPLCARPQDTGVPDDLVLEGNLEILGRLGEGASGVVQKAKHIPTGLLMAKKTMSTSPNPSIHRQILRELSFNRSCHSDHIVRYYGAFLEDEDTSIAICMEYCEAGCLSSIYKRVKARGGRIGEKILGKVSECMLKGLAYLHERKIIHRDIKPSNVLVTRQGQVKLCDFGVSGELINSMAGTFTGTSYYMAPERIQGLPYTISSDVWSLGLTILEMASNRFPFPPEGEPALGPIDLLSYVISMKVPELKDDEAAGVKWSKALRDFIERCLEKDGTKRPGPNKMMSHPFIKKSETRVPQPDLGRFVAEVWGWPSPESQATSISTHNTPTSTDPVHPLGRSFSLRQAPKPDATPTPAVPSLPALTKDAAGKPQLKLTNLDTIGGIDPQGRTAADRTAAKMREADLGLVGSPTEEFAPPLCKPAVNE